MGNRKNYGLPYMGSKNFIAEDIARLLPRAENFYDLFCGGGAILEAVIEKRKYKNYFANELNYLTYDGLKRAFNGDYENEKRWISREDFFKLKDTDFYVYSCFSFGNDGKTYCYGKYNEPWKKALHYARVFNDFSLFREFGIKTNDASKINIKKHFAEYKEKYIRWFCKVNNINRKKILKKLNELKIKLGQEKFEKVTKLTGAVQLAFIKKAFTNIATNQFLQSLQSLQSLESLQSLQSLESLQSLQRLQRLQNFHIGSKANVEFSNKDYREIEIKKNSVVYFDPPYFNTEPYAINGEVNKFNHNDFYDYVEKLAERDDVKIFISEYSLPQDRFTKIKEFQKVSFMCSNALTRGQNTDNIYVPKKQEWEDEEILPIFDSFITLNG